MTASDRPELGCEQADDHAEEGRGAVADLVVLEQALVDEGLAVLVDPDRFEQAADRLPGDAGGLVDRAKPSIRSRACSRLAVTSLTIGQSLRGRAS
jgi:hypothetical protein